MFQGITMPIIRSPSNCRFSLWFPYECVGGSVLSRGRFVTNRPQLRTLPLPHSYGNQRMQRQFDGLLMMGIVMPETCWAVSVRQRNKILGLIFASSWVFYLSDRRCTEPQALLLASNTSHWGCLPQFPPKRSSRAAARCRSPDWDPFMVYTLRCSITLRSCSLKILEQSVSG